MNHIMLRSNFIPSNPLSKENRQVGEPAFTIKAAFTTIYTYLLNHVTSADAVNLNEIVMSIKRPPDAHSVWKVNNQVLLRPYMFG